MSDQQTAFDFAPVAALMESALRDDAKAAKADCPACYWDRVPARAFRLCGHPTLTDDETIRSPLHECPGFRPYDNAGKPLASQTNHSDSWPT